MARCRGKKFTFAISSPDEFLVFNVLFVLLRLPVALVGLYDNASLGGGSAY